MKLLILSTLISVVLGCIPQGFSDVSLIDIEGFESCHVLNVTVSCGINRQTSILPFELIKETSKYEKSINDAYLSFISLLLDSDCCQPQLNMDSLNEGYGYSYDYDGYYLYSLPEDEPSGAVYGLLNEDEAMDGGNFDYNLSFVDEFVANYPLQTTIQTTALSCPMPSLAELINHAYIQESAKSSSNVLTIEISNEIASDSWFDEERQRKIASKLLSVVAVGILGLEAVLFMLGLLIFVVPSDEEEILETLGLLIGSKADSRDVGIQVDSTSLNQNKSESKAPKNSSSKSVPALSKNKKVQKKGRAKSTTGQMNKKIDTMPMIEEVADVAMDEISSSNA